MGRIKFVIFAAALIAIPMAWMGCGDDDVSTGGGAVCPDDDCISCESDEDCAPGTHCESDEEVCVKDECEDHSDCEGDTFCDDDSELCTGWVCEPGTASCEGSAVRHCDSAGSGYGAPDECDSGVCEGGQCGCDDATDCADGESCSDGACVCSSGEVCQGSGICCGDGEVCAESEVCDDDGDCETIQECRPECGGEICGLEGELCCEGDQPVCGPGGGCAPDCSGLGELCGDDFSGCCSEGDVCIFGGCVTPGDSCENFTDCDFGEYCDEGLGRCLPDEFPDGLICEEDVDFDAFEIEELWNWDGIELDRLYDKVQSIPVTANIMDNGSPDIVITPYWGDQPNRNDDQHNGVLVVVDGATGDTVYHNAQRTFSGQGHSAVADITGDGRPEIATILGENNSGGLALVENPQNCPDPEADEHDCIRWVYRGGNLTQYTDFHGMGPIFADINGDGNVEIVMGSTVIDADTGERIAQGSMNSRGYNGPHGNWGSPAVADLDGSGTLEILTGDCAWEVDFDDGELVEVWCNDDFNNGMVAVADIVASDGRQGMPEVAVVRSGVLYILDGQSGETIYNITVPGGGQGGPPNVADFDGDGTVEIGFPGEQCYSVFDVACIDGADEPGECEQPEFPDCTVGEDCVVDPCNAPGLSDGSGDGVLWSIEVQDRSEATGSSVFDFQGNGRNEVVYNDECRLLVLDGQSGQPLIARMNTTRTATEYPLVVDINGDGRTNIAVIANNDQYNRDCAHFFDEGSSNYRPDWFPECVPDEDGERPERCETGTAGVIALQDVHDAWVSTRQIWNQFAYHIGNINDDASVPQNFEAPWETHNTFRANQQGELPLNAPDVVVNSVQVHSQMCPPYITLRATIENAGMSGIPEGMPVSLYLIDSVGEAQLAITQQLDTAISPGGVATMDFDYEVSTSQFNQDLSFQISANDDGQGGVPIPDCNPDDATAFVDGVRCSIQL